jgi:hypothetical protein
VSQPWFLTGDPREKTPPITSVFRYPRRADARRSLVVHSLAAGQCSIFPAQRSVYRPRRADVRRSCLRAFVHRGWALCCQRTDAVHQERLA